MLGFSNLVPAPIQLTHWSVTCSCGRSKHETTIPRGLSAAPLSAPRSLTRRAHAQWDSQPGASSEPVRTAWRLVGCRARRAENSAHPGSPVPLRVREVWAQGLGSVDEGDWEREGEAFSGLQGNGLSCAKGVELQIGVAIVTVEPSMGDAEEMGIKDILQARRVPAKEPGCPRRNGERDGGVGLK